MVYLLMAVIQIVYVSLNSFRVVLMIKGKKYLASGISMVEIFVYISGLTLVLNQAQTTLGLIIYSVTFGIGILVGIIIEQKIALGYISLHVVSEYNPAIAPALRERGYGVTTWIGEGASGPRLMYVIMAKRKNYSELCDEIRKLDPKAFIVSSEPSNVVGGYWTKRIR